LSTFLSIFLLKKKKKEKNFFLLLKTGIPGENAGRRETFNFPAQKPELRAL
jgi:hypothetical protein